MEKVALYLRSSKDRSDVSIDSQRRELEALAASKNYAIIHEYSDVVESAKDDDRDGFQELLRALKSRSREWTTLLITDTSRLSRRQYMAYAFDHECQKRQIKVVYSKLPESDPITDMVIKGVFRVFDELHSLMSRQKGLAGMKENVQQGWRAGGRAPIGYQLQYVETGAIREGQAVKKSRLIVDENAPKIKKYLEQRALGRPRAKLGIDLNKSSLVDLEWNALLYAGHTVWNMRYPKTEGRKRRPRKEWELKKDTHEALITQAEAEIILKKLESHTKRRVRKYLLSGLLTTPEGIAWHGGMDRGKPFYRVKGKSIRVNADDLEKSITEQVKKHILSPELITNFTTAVSERYLHQTDTSQLRAQIESVNSKIEALIDMSLEMENRAPILRKVDDLEESRMKLTAELDDVIEENEASKAAANVTPAQIKKIIQWNQTDITEALPSLVEKITLDEQMTSCEVTYCVRMASPRGYDLNAVIRYNGVITL